MAVRLQLPRKKAPNPTDQHVGRRVRMRPRMGRKLCWPERVMAKLAAGTLARIAAVLENKEARTAFLRAAIEREIERRQRQKKGRR
jgi:hypothetical protein